MVWTKTTNFATVAIGAGVLLALTAQLAAAGPALAIANVNLRQGPGTTFGIITTIPGGSTVDVAGCTGDWCNVHWNGRGGYILARNLDMSGGPGPGPGVVAGPYAPPGPYYGAPVVVGGPYPYYWGPRYYGGPRWGYRGRRW